MNGLTFLLATSGLAVLGMSTDCCPREGCEAVDRPAKASIDRGLAGSAASPSDVVANGCQECGLTQGTLTVYAAASPITNEAVAAETFSNSEPAATIDIDGDYERALEPGWYLVCVEEVGRGQCKGVEVPSQGIVTVHLVFPFGPVQIVVFEPGAGEPRGDMPFDLMRVEDGAESASPH